MVRFITWVLLTSAGVAFGQTAGKSVFDAHCARCHGIGGTGGEGPSLAVSVLRHAADDESLAMVIQNGIENTDMPGNWMLGVNEIEALVRYVRSLSRVDEAAPPGNPERGEQIFGGKGTCSVCHIVNGEGGTIGPDLTAIGATRGVDHLRESLVAPGEKVSDRYVLVRAVTRDGFEVIGTRVNEDSFTVQLRGDAGQFHSLDKLTLTTYEKKFGESSMPGFATQLTPEELEDVVAYLASLRGEP